MHYSLTLLVALTITSTFNLRGVDLKSPGVTVARAELKKDGRVANGKHISKGQIPYQVEIKFLEDDDKYKTCGGVLIGRKWVLTAASCYNNTKSIVVSMGNKFRWGRNVSFDVPITRFFSHPDFNATDKSNNIALVLIPKVQLSKRIGVARLPFKDDSYPSYENETVIISGWGKVYDSKKFPSNQLRWGRMRITNNKKCEEFTGGSIGDSNMCAESDHLVSPCEGDEGGPVTTESDGTLIGLFSSGTQPTCENGYPVLFTRITTFLDWIEVNTGVYGKRKVAN